MSQNNYTTENNSIFKPNIPKDPMELAKLRRENNPSNQPVGNFTGRCRHCGSSNLWDDNLHYGCNDCSALLG